MRPLLCALLLAAGAPAQVERAPRARPARRGSGRGPGDRGALRRPGHSVPVLKLKPIKKTNNKVLIYAHGNASDLLDSLAYIDRLSKNIQT